MIQLFYIDTKMKRTLTFIGLLLVTIQACLAYDHVILRNGK